jgi:Transposase, Mutator family
LELTKRSRTLKTSLGPVKLQRPKLRHAHAALCDQLFGQGVTRTNALETLVISCWVRGLSDRDVEAMLVEVFGEQATISRTTASRIYQRLRAEFDAWKRRDLSTAKIDYLYVDGSFFKMHPKARAEPVLCAWGIDTDGHAVFLGLAPGAAESTDAWRGFLQDLGDRGFAPRYWSSPTAARACARRSSACCPPACTKGVWCRCAATSSPRSPSMPKARSSGTTGRSSTRSSTTVRPPPPRAPTSQAVHRQVEAAVPLRGRLCGRQPRRAAGPPAVPHRASQAHPPLQPDRAHLRRDSPQGEGDRPAAR